MSATEQSLNKFLSSVLDLIRVLRVDTYVIRIRIYERSVSPNNVDHDGRPMHR